MKKFTLFAFILAASAGMLCADIQAPPGSLYTSERKFGRGLSNVLYSFTEIPENVFRKNDSYGRKGGWGYGLVAGVNRMFRRIGYGFHEMFTFRCPTYHGTFKPPYTKCGIDDRIEMNPRDGLSEFPPELGFETYFRHSRTQRW